MRIPAALVALFALRPSTLEEVSVVGRVPHGRDHHVSRRRGPQGRDTRRAGIRQGHRVREDRPAVRPHAHLQRRQAASPRIHWHRFVSSVLAMIRTRGINFEKIKIPQKKIKISSSLLHLFFSHHPSMIISIAHVFIIKLLI